MRQSSCSSGTMSLEGFVQRDSFLGEHIVWESGPRHLRTPAMFRASAALLFAFSLISLAYALVIGLALGQWPMESLVFAVWCVTLGFAVHHLPVVWLSKVRYQITTNHVVYRRGPFRRTIERGAISFARIYWYADRPGYGDLELIRAVPTGALRRRLMLRLDGLAAPDRVWAIVRGAEAVAPVGEAERPLAQRLDAGETVLWSARPRPSYRAYLPRGHREWSLVVLGVILLAGAVRMIWSGVPALVKVKSSGLELASVPFAALVFAIGSSIALVLAIAAFIVYAACLRPGYLVRHTRYLITDRRVLIQRDREELHLDRSRIVDVIDTPAPDGMRDVFLVLDGPRARAVAASGAFGELDRGPNLRPVLRAVDDAEGLVRALRDPSASHAVA